MFNNGIARSLSTAARRMAAPAKQAVAPALRASPAAWSSQQMARPFSVLGSSTMQKLAAQKLAVPQAPAAAAVAPPAQVGAAAEQVAQQAQQAAAVASQQGGSVAESLRNNNMVFEIGLSFVVLHYQSIFIGVMRCLFQSFRPLLILFVFGQIIKAVFFIAGAPIWMSFYSIWLFEVGYGLAQCAISFIFISFFYNNMSFNRIRPQLSQMLRQQKDKVARAAAALGL